MSSSVYLVATVIGTSLIALWLYARFPGLRPERIAGAAKHVLFSFVAMKIGQLGLGTVLHAIPSRYGLVLALLAITVPVLSYVFVSWVWLLASLRGLGGSPRGGHPVSAAARG
ncbi:MAG TPA: hypothetical protein VKC62_10690 [Gaiellaceae bacterium]|nr:hypothetical protein [Gaiellaceae bacterium]